MVPGELRLTLVEGRLTHEAGKGMLEGPVSARVALDVGDVGELVAAALGREPTIEGGLRGALTISGTLSRPRAAGDVELERLTVTRTSPGCAEPRRRTLDFSRVRIGLAWDDGRWRARPVTASLAGGRLALELAGSLEPGGRLEATDLVLTALPVERLLVDFLCQGWAVAGSLTGRGTTAFSPTDPWSTLGGSGSLRVGPGRIVGAQAVTFVDDLARAGAVVARLAGVEARALASSALVFDSITGSYEVRNGVVRTRDLVYAGTTVRATVAGSYGLVTERLDADVRIVHELGEIAARVIGPAASPAVAVTRATASRRIDVGQIERALGEIFRRRR